MLIAVLIGAPVVGILMILLIANFSPNVGQEAEAVNLDLPEITGDEFADVISDLMEASDLTVVFSSLGTGGVVEMTVRDPRPLSGGRMVVHATPVLRDGKIGAAEILSFADGVRSEPGTLKGMYFALAGFTEEAVSAKRAAPGNVDLIDAPRLLELVSESLSAERAEELRQYRGFGSLAAKSPRESVELEDLGQRPGPDA